MESNDKKRQKKMYITHLIHNDPNQISQRRINLALIESHTITSKIFTEQRHDTIDLRHLSHDFHQAIRIDQDHKYLKRVN